MNIIGYTNKLSFQSGETVNFMIDCKYAKYTADIVRLIHGDDNPKGPGFKEEFKESLGEYSGRRQNLHLGSYILIPNSSILEKMNKFTLQAWIYPTTPKKGIQGLLTKWSNNKGYGLFINERGCLALWIGDGEGNIDKLSMENPLKKKEWCLVSGTCDLKAKKMKLFHIPFSKYVKENFITIREQQITSNKVGVCKQEFLISGYWNKSNVEDSVTGHYNGKIDSPKIFSDALKEEKIKSIMKDESTSEIRKSLIAEWDFSSNTRFTKIIDISSNGLHGKTINSPKRAVTGHNWIGKEMNYNYSPEEYNAIHFHADDLDNAGWKVDFRYTIGKEFPSGVYAAHLRTQESEDYVPFFVRPKKGEPSSSIAFIVPTFTYQAYANSVFLYDPKIRAGFEFDYDYPIQEHDKYAIENGLNGMYDCHEDGSGVCYSSRLRPMTCIRPTYRSQHLADGHGAPSRLNADLHLLNWMETKGYKFDIITDEDIHLEGIDILTPYKVVLTGNHPEYYSIQMLDSLDSYLNRGGRLMYLGGNGFYWVVSTNSQNPHLIEVRRWGGTQSWTSEPGEYYHSTTGELGGLWRNRGRAPQKLVGVGMTAAGTDQNSPYYRKPESFDPKVEFIFDGIGKDEIIGNFESLQMNRGAAGHELDRLDYDLGTPSNTFLLASSSGHSDSYHHAVEEVFSMDSKQGGTVNPFVRADMVYFEHLNGGAVFSVGSISWCGSLSYNNYENNVSRITENVLKKFSSE